METKNNKEPDAVKSSNDEDIYNQEAAAFGGATQRHEINDSEGKQAIYSS